MKKKLLGIFVCMLLIATAIPASGIDDSKVSTKAQNIDISSQIEETGNSFEIEIIKPQQGYLYLNDNKFFQIFFLTLIIGSITIEAEVTGGTAEKVEFYVDGVLKRVDYNNPYTWVWDETVFFSHTIKVIAYDSSMSTAEAELSVLIFNIGGAPQELTKEEAIEILIDEVIDPDTLDHTLYAFTLDEPLRAGDKIAPWLPDPLPAHIQNFPYLEYRETQEPEWFFWIDDAPRAKCDHDTRFVYIDAVTGDIEVENEKWWAVLNDEGLWTSDDDYWNPDNWAYTNDNPPYIQTSTTDHKNNDILYNRDALKPEIESSVARSRTSVLDSSDCSSCSLGGECAIVINGWSEGQTVGEDMAKDAEGMGLFWGTYPGFTTQKINPPNNQKDDIEDAFENTKDCDDCVVYITAHGGIDAAGEPYVSCGGTKVTEDDLCKMIAENPDVEYKFIIDCCHSGSFIESLSQEPNTAKICTASDDCETAYGDWDPPNDPNPDDEGSEWTSGFVEDLWEEWLNNPNIDILDLLNLAFDSACAKDACAINGYTHPQVWERWWWWWGFEDGLWPPYGWYTIVLNEMNTWGIIDVYTYPEYVHSGDYAAWVNYDYTMESDEWLITPEIDLTMCTDATLSFWAISDTMYPGATTQVFVNEEVIWDMIEDENWETFEYREVSLDLGEFVGSDVTIAWRYVGFDGESFGLDDISITARFGCPE